MKKTKRLLSMTLALVMALFTLSAGLVVQAEDTVKLSSLSLWAGSPSYESVNLDFPNMSDEYAAKLVSIKSSNTKVLKARKDGDTMWSAQVLPLKAGKSKVTVTYQLDGKKQSVSGTLTVRNAPHPFQWVKVNGKKLDVSKTDFEYDLLNWKKTSAKVEWKLKKGWTMDQAVSYSSKGSGELKNGGTVKVPKNEYAEVELNMGNEDGNNFRYTIGLYNGKSQMKKDTLWLGLKGAEYPLSLQNLPYAARVVSLKSSNQKVIKARKGDKLSDCVLVPKKKGTSKITLTVKINGKKQEYDATYTVKNYPDAITELKVDGEKVNLKKNRFAFQKKVNKDQTKLEYKIGKGWKLKKCQYWDSEKEKYVSLKSGGSVKTKKTNSGWTSEDGSELVCMVHFILTNKSNDTFEYYVTLER